MAIHNVGCPTRGEQPPDVRGVASVEMDDVGRRLSEEPGERTRVAEWPQPERPPGSSPSLGSRSPSPAGRSLGDRCDPRRSARQHREQCRASGGRPSPLAPIAEELIRPGAFVVPEGPSGLAQRLGQKRSPARDVIERRGHGVLDEARHTRRAASIDEVSDSLELCRIERHCHLPSRHTDHHTLRAGEKPTRTPVWSWTTTRHATAFGDVNPEDTAVQPGAVARCPPLGATSSTHLVLTCSTYGSDVAVHLRRPATA